MGNDAMVAQGLRQNGQRQSGKVGMPVAILMVVFGLVSSGVRTTQAQAQAGDVVSPDEAANSDALNWFRMDDAQGADSDGPPVSPPLAESPSAHRLELPDTLQQVEPVSGASLSPEMTGWVRWILLKNLPAVHENNKKWGMQKKVLDGWELEWEGLRLKTKRRYKLANHGTWTRYYIEPIDPVNRFKVSIDGLRQTGPQRFRFEFTASLPVQLFARVSRYQWDVQFYSLSADADAAVRLWAAIETDLLVQPLSLPPVVRFQPQVVAARCELTEFQIRRISQMHGPLARQLGILLREILEDKVRQYDDRLVEKMNQQIAKHGDKLTVTIGDWLDRALEKASAPASP
jgi:hypothetical protein